MLTAPAILALRACYFASVRQELLLSVEYFAFVSLVAQLHLQLARSGWTRRLERIASAVGHVLATHFHALVPKAVALRERLVLCTLNVALGPLVNGQRSDLAHGFHLVDFVHSAVVAAHLEVDIEGVCIGLRLPLRGGALEAH